MTYDFPASSTSTLPAIKTREGVAAPEGWQPPESWSRAMITTPRWVGPCSTPLCPDLPYVSYIVDKAAGSIVQRPGGELLARRGRRLLDAALRPTASTGPLKIDVTVAFADVVSRAKQEILVRYEARPLNRGQFRLGAPEDDRCALLIDIWTKATAEVAGGDAKNFRSAAPSTRWWCSGARGGFGIRSPARSVRGLV